jgi:hypothetical protein
MKIEVNLLEKKYLVFLISSIVVIIGVVGVVASHGFNVPNPGHSINEIGEIPQCDSGQALSHTSSGWSCTNAGSGEVELYDCSESNLIVEHYVGGEGWLNCPSGKVAIAAYKQIDIQGGEEGVEMAISKLNCCRLKLP